MKLLLRRTLVGAHRTLVLSYRYSAMKYRKGHKDVRRERKVFAAFAHGLAFFARLKSSLKF